MVIRSGIGQEHDKVKDGFTIASASSVQANTWGQRETSYKAVLA